MSCAIQSNPAGNQANPPDGKGRLGEFEFLVLGREKTRDRIAYFFREAFDLLPEEDQEWILEYWRSEREQSTVLPEFSPFIALLQGPPAAGPRIGVYSRLVADVTGAGHWLYLRADVIDAMPDFVPVVSLGVMFAAVHALACNVVELTDNHDNVHGYLISDEIGIRQLSPYDFELHIQRVADEWGFNIEGWRHWLLRWKCSRPANSCEASPECRTTEAKNKTAGRKRKRGQ